MGIYGIESVFDRIHQIQSRFFRRTIIKRTTYNNFDEKIERAQEELFKKLKVHNNSNTDNSMKISISSLEPIIKRASEKYGVPEKLIKSVIKQESNFNPKAVSKKGAKGLMQLMPETAKILGVKDIFNPEENIDGGTKYLRAMLDRFGGDIIKALAAYNAGPEVVEKYNGVPNFSETKSYVKNVLKYIDMF